MKACTPYSGDSKTRQSALVAAVGDAGDDGDAGWAVGEGDAVVSVAAGGAVTVGVAAGGVSVAPSPVALPPHALLSVSSNKKATMRAKLISFFYTSTKESRKSGRLFHIGDGAKGRTRRAVNVQDAIGHRVILRAAAFVTVVKVE